MTTTLRKYQLEALDLVRAEMRAGRKRVCLVLPTGAGKTVVAAEAVRSSLARGGRVIWLVGRRELVNQACATLAKAGLDVGAVCDACAWESNPNARVQVASIQTLLASGDRPEATFLVSDECHHMSLEAEKWSGLLSHYVGAPVLGLTATPERSSGAGLAPMFDGLVVGATVRQLIALNATDPTTGLVPCEVIRPNRMLERGQIAQDPIAAYKEHADGTQAVLFAPSKELAKQYAEAFMNSGIRAAFVHDGSTKMEREVAIELFQEGKIRVLTNVFLFTEGSDFPMAKTCILVRGMNSASTYLQAVGRVLRPYRGQHAKLIDLRGISHVHGMPEDERLYSLEGKGIKLAAKECYCPVCGSLRESGEGCGVCGWQPGAPDDRDKSLEITNDPLVKYKRLIAQGPDQRWETLVRWMRALVIQDKNTKSLFYKWKHCYQSPLPGEWYQKALRLVNEEMR